MPRGTDASRRHTPMRITQPAMLTDAVRKHAIAADTVNDVFNYVINHPWASVPEISGALLTERATVREALKRRKEFGVVQRRTSDRSPYRYAHESVAYGPDVEADLRATALPWKLSKQWNQESQA